MTALPPDVPDVEVGVLKVALCASEDRFRLLVDAVTEYAIFTLGTDGVIESWNSGAERMKGYTHDEAVGRHFSMLYTAEDRDAGVPQRGLDRAQAEGTHETTGWRVTKDGTRFWSSVVISAACDDSGNHTGFVKVVRDRTQQHRLEQAQTSFYNSFEHDFRLPLTAIQGFADLLGDASPQESAHFVERIKSNADRLLTMVEEMVDYARLRSGLTPISLETVDMLLIADHAVTNLASIAATSRVRATAGAGVMVRADPAALERVVANLVVNALKYSPAESEVHVICERVEGKGVLRVVDQGRGIDERDIAGIFLEFERGRLAQNDYSGTGLGLASVKRLVQGQGGTISISSRVDLGTTVTIHLPLAP